MKIDIQMISPYLHKQELSQENHWIYQYTQGTQSILPHRQEVVQTLLKELAAYPKSFPIFNPTLITKLFPNYKNILDDIILLPIVGASASFDCGIIQQDGKNYLLIDLLHVADYTPIVSQMTYILHNMVHIQLLQYLMKLVFPAPKTFMEQLESIFFIDGFAQYLAWNKDCATYSLQSKTYKKDKDRCFPFLYQILTIQDSSNQKHILKQLQDADLWDNFVLASAIFFLDDIYQKMQEKGLYACYAHGPKDIFKLVF